MNKVIFLIVFPCVVGFILVQAYYPGMYGGYPGGYGMYGGYGVGYPYARYAVANNVREDRRSAVLLSSLIGFFVLLFLFNFTGQILG